MAESLPSVSSMPNRDEPETDAKAAEKSKITIMLKPTGDAPIISKKKWAVPPEQTVSDISEKIRKLLKFEENERLFLYVHQTFAPAPDQTLRNLYDCYSSEGTLIFHYSKMQAWG